MRENYKISEIAKIFNISRRTLLYYDEIDLLKPYYIDEETGYRYYSEDQVYTLRFILTLKNSGFSLNEIKKYSTCENLDDIQIFLDDKVKKIERKINQLEGSLDILKKRNNDLDKFKNSEVFKPKVVTDLEFRLIVIDVEEPYRYVQIEKALDELSDLGDRLKLEDRTQVSIVSEKNVKSMDIYPINSVAYMLTDEIEHDSIIEIKSSKYVTLTYKESIGSLEESYKKLLEFITHNSYKIAGDAIEIIDARLLYVETNLDKIVEIFIPVK